jgi:UPF0755 protein
VPGGRAGARAPAGRRLREAPGERPSRARHPTGPGRLAAVALALALVIVVVALIARGPIGSSRQPKARAIVTITIPEGFTRIQIAQLAREKGLTGSYLQAANGTPSFDPSRYGAPRGLPNLEGFLFPATYQLYAGSPAQALLARQLEAFEERFGPQLEQAAKHLGLTPYQLLIVASMVQREAGIRSDFPRIAAVIYNRLRAGMSLGIDATIRYALGDPSGPLSEAQLHTNSPYNTRLHKGLPPTPISNPGMEAIEAAAHPAQVGYLYYVASPSGCGESVFADTYEEFEQDAAAYHRAVAENGGNPPLCRRR